MLKGLFRSNSRHEDSSNLDDRAKSANIPVLCGSKFCRLLSRCQITGRSGPADILHQFFEENSLLRKDKRDIREHGVQLGTRGEITSRKGCAFCRLANAAILESPQRLRWFEDEKIFVLWDRGREGFNLSCAKTTKASGIQHLPLGERIRLCSKSSRGSHRAGRALNPNGIDPDLIRNWIGLCDNNHKDSCFYSSPRLQTLQLSEDQILLIDVRNKCIVRRRWGLNYIALSYVWGLTNQLTLSKSNFHILTSPLALQNYKHSISKTIWDAMCFIDRIGERYLWADSLCLVQDDPEFLRRGVQLMDLIYEGAYLTIIAANGSDSDAGLPINRPAHQLASQRLEEVTPELSLAVVRAVDCYLRKSVWASRGWTYQEEISSRRSIIFVNNQAYFRCRQRIWAEDTWADLNPSEQDLDEWSTSWVSVIQDVALHRLIHPLDRLFDLIEGFQLRSLTRDSDAINAVTGILQPLSQRMRTSLLEGLPICAFDLTLLFSHLHPVGESTPGRRRLDFPSWSWAGWVGRTHWNAFHELYGSSEVAGINQWLDQRTWIIWYKYQHGKFAKIVRYTEPVGESERTNRDIMYERRSPLPSSGRFPGLRTQRTEPSNCFVNSKTYPLLAFFTVSIILTVSSYIPAPFLQPQTLHLDALFDAHNTFCGFLSPDIRHAAIEQARLELILLSECRESGFPLLDRKGMEDRIHPIWSSPDNDNKPDSINEKDNKNNSQEGQPLYPGNNPSSNLQWPLFWVLAVSWTGEAYERRGLGQIVLSAVDRSLKPGPRWREIILG